MLTGKQQRCRLGTGQELPREGGGVFTQDEEKKGREISTFCSLSAKLRVPDS